MGMFTLLIVDDHPIVLSGLRLLLGAHATFDIRGEAHTAADARALAERIRPDAIVTDLAMGEVSGVMLVEDLAAAAPHARILVYSSHDETVWAPRAIRAGACGYVSKAEPLDAVALALDTVMAGGVHVSPAVQRHLVHSYAGTTTDQGLSPREEQVLRLIAGGGTLQSLAQELQLSVKTVGTYRERLKIKLGLDSVRMLERYATDYVAGQARPT